MAYTHRARPFLCSRLVMSNQEQIVGKHITNSIYLFPFPTSTQQGSLIVMLRSTLFTFLYSYSYSYTCTCSTLRTKSQKPSRCNGTVLYMSGILYACVGLPDTSTYILCVPLRQSGHGEDGKIWLLEDAVARWQRTILLQQKSRVRIITFACEKEVNHYSVHTSYEYLQYFFGQQ